MSSYVFTGYPAFLEVAAAELGHPESAAPARRIVPLTALANLCAQAALADPVHVEGILAKAGEFRDQLATALKASEMMLADVEAGRRLMSSRRTEVAEASTPAPTSTPDPRPCRKGPRI